MLQTKWDINMDFYRHGLLPYYNCYVCPIVLIDTHRGISAKKINLQIVIWQLSISDTVLSAILVCLIYDTGCLKNYTKVAHH